VNGSAQTGLKTCEISRGCAFWGFSQKNFYPPPTNPPNSNLSLYAQQNATGTVVMEQYITNQMCFRCATMLPITVCHWKQAL